MRKLTCIAVTLLLVVAALFASGPQEVQKEVVLQWPCIWVAKDSKAATVEALVTRFNADNLGKIRVVIEPNPDYDGYRNKINTMMAAGQVPDLFHIGAVSYHRNQNISELLARADETLAQAASQGPNSWHAVEDSTAMVVLPAPDKVSAHRLRDVTGAKEVELASEKEFGDLFPKCLLADMLAIGEIMNNQSELPVIVEQINPSPDFELDREFRC